MEYMAAQMDRQIEGSISENERLSRENDLLRAALQKIVHQQPCNDGGGCFYPMHDGEGNYIGEDYVDPMSVICGMAQIAQEALAATESPQ